MLRGDVDLHIGFMVFRTKVLLLFTNNKPASLRYIQCFFLGFFRRFRRLTRRNSELDEDFAELDKNFDELG